MNEFQLAFLKQLAKGLAAQFGENCEIVVHDLNKDHLDQSIVAIENGHVTKRQLGDGPSHAVLQGLKNPQELSDHLNYLTRTQDGRILKSSTIYIRDEKGQVVGLFAINYDITHLLMAESALRPLTSAQSEDRDPEPIVQNVNDLLDELIAQSVQLVGKPVALMTKDDKIKAIQFLNGTGAFLITKSGDKVSRYFGISKYTLYNYISSEAAT
ncbi:MAG: helix-turn-helix transcriptional regulator [Candidatus Limiplasma sp.]|nr:helix-turn-helix transcriptional regulator [Candidatus Limiplasma sp.]